jgi:ubiquinone/menaquinone biosynthesis C-methylase UbiE
MKLNWVETLVMNNPIRARVQRRREAPGLLALAPRAVEGAETLIVGCGRGVDIEIALDDFGASRVTAIDLDERQVARAEKRLRRAGSLDDRIRLEVGDATKLRFPDASFDLVLDFGIIHHIPAWQEAIGELHRVLRPGGQLLFEEIPRSELDTALFRLFTDHPRENRFGPDDFRAECERRGLEVADRLEEFRLCCFKAFRGAAVRRGGPA